MTLPGARWSGPDQAARERLVPAVLAALATAMVVMSIGPYPVGVFQDDGIYTVLAKSLATGEGYRYLQMPGTPNATHYPPLYPLFLAVIWKVFPSFPANITLFKFANAAFVGLATLFTWQFARRYVGMGAWSAGLTVAAFACGTPVVFVAVMALSEPMFLAALFPVLMLCERASRSGTNRDALLAGVAGGLLAMVRTLGVVALPATALVLAWRRRWLAAALVCAAGFVVMLPWQLWIAANDGAIHPLFMGKYGSYGGWLAEGVSNGGIGWIAAQVELNTRLLIVQGWEMLGAMEAPGEIRWPATVLLVACFVWGWVLLLRRAPVAALFTALYMALVLPWPFGPSRFTFAIWPLAGLQVGLAFATVASWRPRLPLLVATRYAGLAVAVLLGAGHLRYGYLAHKYGWWTQAQQPVAERARYLADWVSTNTPEDALFATEDDLLIYLYTGRQAVPLGTFTPNDHMEAQTHEFLSATLRQILRTYEVDYVLASTDIGAFAARGLLRSQPPELELVRAFKMGAVFRPATRGEAQ